MMPTSAKKEGLRTSTHSIFPSYRMIDESVISKMELDTVFFIFYFQKVKIKKSIFWSFRQKTSNLEPISCSKLLISTTRSAGKLEF